MADESLSGEARFDDAEDISDQGERVSHLVHDANFFSHLSIYDYALKFSQGAVILDAGCGAGYGSNFLAERGARLVWGVDASSKAVEFSRHHFKRPNLKFDVMELQHVTGFEPQYFDFIFSSQALEHVPDVVEFVKAARRILKPAGTLMAAVPTITDDRFLYLNVVNPYHVNIWTPRQWEYVFKLYFQNVELLLHGVREIGQPFKPEDFSETVSLTEKDFAFRRGTMRDIYRVFSLNAVFVVRDPREEGNIPKEGEAIKFVDESFSRPQGYISSEMRARLRPYFETPAPLLTEPVDPLRGRNLRMQTVWDRLRSTVKGKP